MDDDCQVEAELQRNFHLLECSSPKLLDQSSQKILHYIVALVMLLNHVYRKRYPIPFLNATAIEVRNLPLFHKIGCHGNVPRRISEKEVQIDHLRPNSFRLT